VKPGRWLLIVMLAGCFRAICPEIHAEDADRFRPYFGFQSGEIAPLWGVDDLWSVSLGANFNKHLGAEMNVGFFEHD
jgi:hypothetical protein